jgi:hypothetical protein
VTVIEGARLAHRLCINTVEQFAERAGMTEVTGPEGDFRILTNARSGEPTGTLRIWTGDGPVKKMVYAGVWAVVPGVIGLDSHMLYAFTDSANPAPHFTLDSVERMDQDTHAFHLDLTPKVDLGSHLDYINEVFMPLQPTFDEAGTIEGITAAQISPRQRAIMSPWMLVGRATPEAYAQLDPIVQVYIDRFFDLVGNGLSPETAATVADTDLARRDGINRSYIFSREVDPVWDQITPLLGMENCEFIRRNLLTNDLVTEIQQ